ncbi:DNA mismatch repair endonuclease MutL [Foetidibacter luteolus]|uniref:DNA mismatch repair endonuclease MutL n=1 Tax=Foetidibacter luteolus TaxID=2608880 RepID=UPI00129BC5C1|nr:DNA mismatch repair endonuclease MutL [Foetidibacter luteolus]
MLDIIQLLPDNIANQIAAGEVIQRPASAVKELLENAVDAGATEIRLIVNDAGKSLIQVIDNGKGMSETDARMCFERHATSKIKNIDDLFHIRTMGFRGEALASIAAVAQVEVKTRRPQDELGTFIQIENSVVLKQEPCACPAGTSICMKNLFFSVPARRNFLKSNASEMRHIVDEFIHVAMAFPQLFFSLTSNGQQLFHLEAGNLKQRVLQVLGSQYSSKLVQVKEETDYMNIYGFVGKPDAARKTRGEQYFFVNNRYIRSAYLNHAVGSAFADLISKDSFPLYVLYIDLDPAQVDINVHPTKQEIKFEDEKIVYAFVQAAVKHALAQFSIAPSLDFTLNADIQQLDAVNKPFTEQRKETLSGSQLFKTFTQSHQAHKIEPDEKSELKHWKEFFTAPKTEDISIALTQPEGESNTGFSLYDKPAAHQLAEDTLLLQLHTTYIIAATQSGFLLVHQQLSHERILYERYSTAIHGRQVATQRSLFPVTLTLSPPDAVLLSELLPDLAALGYLVEPFGKDSFVIQGTPADLPQGNEKHSIELLIEQFKHFSSDVKFSRREKLVRCLSRQQAIKAGQQLTQQEMRSLVEELFTCNTPNITPTGSPTYIEFKEDYLDRMFGR